jgi:hypothetical protein
MIHNSMRLYLIFKISIMVVVWMVFKFMNIKSIVVAATSGIKREIFAL